MILFLFKDSLKRLSETVQASTDVKCPRSQTACLKRRFSSDVYKSMP